MWKIDSPSQSPNSLLSLQNHKTTGGTKDQIHSAGIQRDRGTYDSGEISEASVEASKVIHRELEAVAEEQGGFFHTLVKMKEMLVSFSRGPSTLEDRVHFAKEMSDLLAKIDVRIDSSKVRQRGEAFGDKVQELKKREGEDSVSHRGRPEEVVMFLSSQREAKKTRQTGFNSPSGAILDLTA